MRWGEAERAGAAVVFGVGEYLHAESVRPLRFAAPDAEAVAKALVDPSICGFPAGKVKLLTDAEAGRDALVHHLSKWLPAHSKGAQIVVIYFAGHGTIQAVGRREEGYLLPHDADPEDIVTRGILMTDLARWIEAIDAPAVVVCLDCCHAAKVITRGPSGSVEPRDMRIRPVLLQALTGRGRYLIASCDEGQVSIEAEHLGHGLFTYHLLDGLRGAGDRDGDGKVGISELFEFVAEAVDREARALGMVQKPWSSSSGPGGVFLSTPLGDDRGPSGRIPQPTSLAAAKRLWREQGPAAAVQAIETAIEGADASELIPLLDLLGLMDDAASVPLLFRCLPHPVEAVRERAKKVLKSYGWERVSATVEDLARRGDGEGIASILDGLAAFEAHLEIVDLLDRLATLLKDSLRTRTILLLERKQQGLAFERVAEFFREARSPYRILKPLGQGLFTAAYLARDESTELDVVVRVLRSEYAALPQIRAEFLDLARRSVKLVHQNLVLTREVRDCSQQRFYYAVRDYVDGVTIQKLLETGRAFTADQIVKILRQIIQALTPIHAGRLTHGSIKSSNVFVRGDQVILGDLALPPRGIGLHLDRLSYDYRYAPPEMFQQGGVVGPWSDLYALGCLAYELACGAPPFVSDNHYELAAKHGHEEPDPPSRRGSLLGPAGDSLILRLLAKAPSGRPADLETALQALEDLWSAVRPRARKPAAAPIVGEESMIRYTTDDMMSIVSLWTDMRPPGDLPGRIGDPLEQDTTMMPDEGRALDDSSLPARTIDENTGDYGGADAPSETPEPLPEEQFGRYVIISQIGRGGMGSVYLARDSTLNRLVAIKLNRARSLVGRDRLNRFETEARAVAQLQHPNIVAIFDVGERDGYLYTVFEFLEGGSLSQKLRSDGPLSLEGAVGLLLVLSRAVQYAHEHGVVHRDLKPSNILLSRDGTPKIGDFGLARIALEEDAAQNVNRTMLGTIVGTPTYMSPEQARGEVDRIGPSTDVYSLGVMLYELLTGTAPFTGSPMEILAQLIERSPRSPRELRPEIPADLAAICLKCLEKQPEARYATAAELAGDLERFRAGLETSARSPLEKGSSGLWDRFRAFFPARKRPGNTGPGGA